MQYMSMTLGVTFNSKLSLHAFTFHRNVVQVSVEVSLVPVATTQYTFPNPDRAHPHTHTHT